MFTSLLNVFGLSTLLLTLGACLSISGSGSVGTSGTGGSSTTGGSSATGGSPTTGGLAAKPYQGYVLFQFAEPDEYQEEAGFYITTAVALCSDGTAQGSCCYRLTAGQEAYGASEPSADVNAGAITFQDGTSTLGSPPFNGSGYSANHLGGGSPLWSTGDTLGVTASGDTSGVAGFSGTVLAPAPLSAVTPSFPMLPTLSRASDFNLTWSPINVGTVTLEIRALNPSAFAPDGSITCTASSSSGSLAVPAALLGNFPTGDEADMELTLANSAALSASNANVELTAAVIVTGHASIQ